MHVAEGLFDKDLCLSVKFRAILHSKVHILAAREGQTKTNKRQRNIVV